MKSKTGKKKWKSWLIVIIILAVLGVVGGVLIKFVFYGKFGDGTMSNSEANRLISYLGIEDYNYTDRLGSSFTFGEAKELAKTASLSYSKLGIDLEHVPGFVPMTRKQFEQLYDSLITLLELDRLSQKDLYIYDIDNANDKEINGILYEVVSTNEGDFFMEKDYGMDAAYAGRVAKLYVSNNEIILCLGDSEKTATINNVYASKVVEDEEGTHLYAYVDGVDRKFLIGSNANISKEMKPALCDLQLGNEGIVTYTDHTKDLVQAKVLSYSDGLVTLEGQEEPFYLSEHFNVYKLNGTFKAMRTAGPLIGYNEVSLYLRDNMIEAALITEDIFKKNIRVVIGTSDYTGYYHDRVTVTSDTDFTVSYGDTVKEYAAGDKVEYRNGSEELAGGSAKIVSKEEDGKITLTSVNRQCGNPSYRGSIELTKNDRGVIVVNELSVEEYLYGVVPSEMPVSYETEALKAQAICARAYAYSQMESENYIEYGAHLDDSVACQVYNNVAEDPKSTYAVDDTYGVIPCYKNQVIEAFFFSTSCGTTSNNSVVWGGNQQPYLLDTMETELNDVAALGNEESFRSFINGELGTGFIEEEEPFFRWNVEFTKEQMTEAINNHLYDRIKAMPENIMALNANGECVKKEIASVGQVESIEVTKRGDSGIIEELVITGTAETIIVRGQSNARALLCPEQVTIVKQDGSSLDGWTSLPSAYFYVDLVDNTFVIHGGGFGHGVGLSQNGANDMAKLGYYASDIISHYYTAVELKDMYELMGGESDN